MIELEWSVDELLGEHPPHQALYRSLGGFQGPGALERAIETQRDIFGARKTVLRWRQRTDFDGVRRAFAWSIGPPLDNVELLEAWIEA